MADTPLNIGRYQETSLMNYIKKIVNHQQGQTALRESFLWRDRVYYRELDWTTNNMQAMLANLRGDPTKLRNITIPVVAPSVRSAYNFFVETFLSSYPIFPVVSPPEYSEIAMQVDAINGEAALRFQYARHLSMMFLDGLKYNLMIAECDWVTKKVYSIDQPKSMKIEGDVVEEDFAGNVIKRINPYNYIYDPRVPITEQHEKADMQGYVEIMSKIQLKKLFLELGSEFTMNAEAAFNSTYPGASRNSPSSLFYVPDVNPRMLDAMQSTDFNWLTWVGEDQRNRTKNPSGAYEILYLYLRIIPKEFGINLGKSLGVNGVPQVFKVIVVNQSTLIYCKRLSNIHDFIPIIAGQMIEDGHDLQTKSFADEAEPYQFISSGLYNAGIASQRRKVFDRIYYDPSRINKADIDKADPIARIPVKQNAFGKNLQEAVYQQPYDDNGIPSLLMMAREVADMSDVSTGRNRVQRGQFQKGNKTRAEFETVMDKSDSGVRSMALVAESGFMQPLKHVIKCNILQYQPNAKLFNMQNQTPVTIEPSKLRAAVWKFKVADGVLPVNNMLNLDLTDKLLNYAGILRQAGQVVPYDLVGAVVYSLQMQGATWLPAFKLNEAQQQQQQAAITNAMAPKPGP